MVAMGRVESMPNLTHLAMGTPAAAEAVEAYSLHVEQLAPAEARVLTKKLARFSAGYIRDLDTLTPRRSLDIRERTNKRRSKKAQVAA